MPSNPEFVVSLRSGRLHKAWGVSPRGLGRKPKGEAQINLSPCNGR